MEENARADGKESTLLGYAASDEETKCEVSAKAAIVDVHFIIRGSCVLLLYLRSSQHSLLLE